MTEYGNEVSGVCILNWGKWNRNEKKGVDHLMEDDKMDLLLKFEKRGRLCV